MCSALTVDVTNVTVPRGKHDELPSDTSKEITQDVGHQNGNGEWSPMNNPVILTRLFELCPPKLLDKFRLVCKLWYQLSLQSWRSQVTCSFSDSSLRRFDREFFWEPAEFHPQFSTSIAPTLQPTTDRDKYATTLQKFLHYSYLPEHECAQKPFRNVQIAEWYMKPYDDQMERFYSVLAPQITVLELDGCRFRSAPELRDVLFTFFPNLKSLTLKNLDCYWKPPRDLQEPSNWKEPERPQHKNLRHLELDLKHGGFPLTWLELFSHFPKMTRFKVYNAEDSTVEKLLTAIKIVRNHDPRMCRITDLDILTASLYAQDRIQPAVALLLRDVNLPLERLTIDFGVDSREESRVKDILTWFAPTLKMLDAYRGPISFPYHNFPFGVQLDCLEEIVMSDRLCDSLSFIRFTPNLKKLSICDCVDDRPPVISTEILENTNSRDLRDARLEKCVELRFDYVVSPRDTKLLIDTLPNVEKLRMPLDNKQFKLVCEGWRDTLRDLEVLGSLLDEPAVTGLSEQDITAFNEAEAAAADQLKTDDDTTFVAVNLDGALRDHPNITDLKHLRKFVMVNDRIQPTKLKDCSVFHGFMLLPNLESLHLRSSIKLRAQNALKEKLYEFGNGLKMKAYEDSFSYSEEEEEEPPTDLRFNSSGDESDKNNTRESTPLFR